ncbi:MAG: enolase C-terminal domain-like protein [bacterium]|nr:enolase C-terminal domain-like protein [bacterium]
MSKIKACQSRKILDSRGDWTIESKVTLESGVSASASIPQGKSTGSREAMSLPAEQALVNVDTRINEVLKGMEVRDQGGVDRKMLELDGTQNKSNLGANSILSISIAVARVAALEDGLPLWSHLRNLYGNKIDNKTPRLFINCINGGVHAGSGLEIQEYVVVPKFDTVRESIEFGAEFYKKLKEILTEAFGPTAAEVGDEGGFAPHMTDNIAPLQYMKQALSELGAENKAELGIDAAASEIKRSSDELSKWYREMRDKYNLFYIEDPFGENNMDDFVTLAREFGGRPMIIGDDLTTTDSKEIEKAVLAGAINGVIIKPNQIGTLTETFEAIRVARNNNLFVIISHRSGETNDDFIADLAWAVGADGIKLGAPARGERVAKYNRLLEIEESEPCSVNTQR